MTKRRFHLVQGVAIEGKNVAILQEKLPAVYYQFIDTLYAAKFYNQMVEMIGCEECQLLVNGDPLEPKE